MKEDKESMVVYIHFSDLKSTAVKGGKGVQWVGNGCLALGLAPEFDLQEHTWY